jgi:cytochrome oxidase Cu insertion factor (SCO1/SenC/PrrC family)
MSRTQKILTFALWGLLGVIVVSLVGAGMWRRESSDESDLGAMHVQPAKEGEVLFNVPAFALTDQNNQPITDRTLRGKPWVAAFIFTHCAGPCPMMSANMVKLQKRVSSPNLRLVSFTVDPTRDTPEVLKQYASNLGADESRWSFVTGTDQQMQDVARGMLMTAVPATESDPIIHSTKFLLVDAEGGVRGVYDSDPAGMDKLADDAAKLAGEPTSAGGSSSPTTQAS